MFERIQEKYNNKKIFITGHTGFKGSWFTYILDSIGAITKGYSLPPITEPSLYKELNFSKNHQSYNGDVNNFDQLKKEIESFNPEFIFHFAAQPIVLKSYGDPMETFKTNFNGTLNLLEIMRHLNLNCTSIFITTDKVYLNKEEKRAFSETDPLGGEDPYSASKAASEILINSYYESFFKKSNMKIASVRAGNVIGGGDWSESRLIPDIIKYSYQSAPLRIRNSLAIRPWQHVLEPLFGYLILAMELSLSPDKFSGSWNFGPEKNDIKTVEQVVKKSIESGLDLNVKFLNFCNEKEANYLFLSIDKAKERLNWIPKWNSNCAINKAINWYKNFYLGISANDLIKKDINSYLKNNEDD